MRGKFASFSVIESLGQGLEVTAWTGCVLADQPTKECFVHLEAFKVRARRENQDLGHETTAWPVCPSGLAEP